MIFLGGFTLALVTGLVRRLLHPADLCDGVVVPSHEHWHIHHSPMTDLAISFVTVFGLCTLGAHWLKRLDPLPEVLIGLAGGVIGAILMRIWLGHISDPIHQVERHPGTATVIREIPVNGFGQVMVTVGGSNLKLAAKASEADPIPEGAIVEILDRQESVVVVARRVD
jgi:hypothetical protein